METASLKSFATRARTELITQVGARIAAVLAPGAMERTEKPRAIRSLEADIARLGGEATGRAAVADRVAYTWFNRIIALRFMDANGYTGAGVVSPAAGQQVGQPEVLADAKRGTFDSDVVNTKTSEAVTGLLDGTRASTDPQSEAYTLLLAEYCRYWHRSMPFMFEREGDYTELLIPANLLADESILARAVATMTPEVCEDVEVIGWLYQFYISERKDEVFAGFKKNHKAGAAEIPAATQLFTPHWIVRYLVENSVGRLWMLNHPESHLVDQMDYYIAPVDEETDFLRISGPEDLTVIDPACGSGHMLTYAFDLLCAIYEEEGYSPSEIPTLILTHNLHGTEIDQRAGALAAFALTMKARGKQRRFFSKKVEPNICVIEPVTFGPDELEFLVAKDADRRAEKEFWNQFEHADVFGALIRPVASLTSRLSRVLADRDEAEDLLAANVITRARRVIKQAQYLARQYSVVVANPPYMGSKQMSPLLAQFMKDAYPDSKSDLFAGFIERCTNLAGPRGTVAMITMQSWMFLSSYQKLRAVILSRQRITSMLHLGTRAFDSIGGEVVSSTAFVLANMPPDARTDLRDHPGTFIRLVDGTSEAEKTSAMTTAVATRTKDTGYYVASGRDFSAIPGTPIVYWLSEKMRSAFTAGKSLGEVAQPRQGLATTENARFLRRWWEIGIARCTFDTRSTHDTIGHTIRWYPYNKGGDFRRWWGNQEYVVNWENDGYEIKQQIVRKYPYLNGNPSFVAKNTDKYFLPSVSWTLISSSSTAFRAYPRGFIFDVAGNSIFPASKVGRNVLIGQLNSESHRRFLEALAPTLNFVVGDVAKVPILEPEEHVTFSHVDYLIEASRTDWDSFETSWSFIESPLVSIFMSSRSVS